MTPAQLAALRAELALPAYAQHLPDAPGHAADALNARVLTMVAPRFITARTVLAELALAGAALLDKLDAIGAQVPAVRWAMVFLRQDSGLDVGHPSTRGLVQALAAQDVLTGDEAQMILDMAVQPASRADQLGLPRVTTEDVVEAING